MLRFELAEKEKDFILIENLARGIWTQHYKQILGNGQIEYMLDKFQSGKAIKQSVDGGYLYYIMYSDKIPVGYMGLKPDYPEGQMFLSKIYINKEYRGKGYLRQSLKYISGLCIERGLSSVWLTVNKNNDSYYKYLSLGFKKVRDEVTDIGNGYVMDDYVMQINLNENELK